MNWTAPVQTGVAGYVTVNVILYRLSPNKQTTCFLSLWPTAYPQLGLLSTELLSAYTCARFVEFVFISSWYALLAVVYVFSTSELEVNLYRVAVGLIVNKFQPKFRGGLSRILLLSGTGIRKAYVCKILKNRRISLAWPLKLTTKQQKNICISNVVWDPSVTQVEHFK